MVIGSMAGNNEYKNIIFDMLRCSARVDFSHYKQSTINRRINRRMVITQKEALQSYIEFLKSDPKELQALYDSMLIGVTSFFREPHTFKTLQQKVYPEILAHRNSDDPVTVWVPGCSTGEETYSIAISLKEFLETQRVLNVTIKILGTDVNRNSLVKAREGIYSNHIECHVTPPRLKKYFRKQPSGDYKIRRSIRNMCNFKEQDIAATPLLWNADIISCRNLLIYFDSYLQEKIIPLLYSALKPQGYLVLGESETVGKFSHLFDVVEAKGAVFIKKEPQAELPSASKTAYSLNSAT